MMKTKISDQKFEFEAFVYTYFTWIVLVVLGLFVFIVLAPFIWCIEYFWGWEILNDFRYPLMKKLSIFTLVVFPLVLIFKETIIFIFKYKIIVLLDKNNQINIRKSKLINPFFTLDTTQPFSIKLSRRQLRGKLNSTYIINFRNERHQIMNLSCPEAIIKKSKNFIGLQEFLQNRLETETTLMGIDTNMKSTIIKQVVYIKKER